jgi:hypothetical protein
MHHKQIISYFYALSESNIILEPICSDYHGKFK